LLSGFKFLWQWPQWPLLHLPADTVLEEHMVLREVMGVDMVVQEVMEVDMPVLEVGLTVAMLVPVLGQEVLIAQLAELVVGEEVAEAVLPMLAMDKAHTSRKRLTNMSGAEVISTSSGKGGISPAL